jgi:hypothetical protein
MMYPNERTQFYSPFLMHVVLAVGCRFLQPEDDYPPAFGDHVVVREAVLERESEQSRFQVRGQVGRTGRVDARTSGPSFIRRS